LQTELIDATQFIEACLLWTTRKEENLADLLLGRGWIELADSAHVEYLVERKLQRHGGNVHASLAAIPDDIKHSLASLGDDDIQRSLAGGLLPSEPPSVATIDYVPGRAERYCRLRLHATGGIGRVWLAHDSDLGPGRRAEGVTARTRRAGRAPGTLPPRGADHRSARTPGYHPRL
jgi:eukaryotic-like serine/threonine-protein kinase